MTMPIYALMMRIEADDDISPDQIREELYNETTDVPFSFDITSITTTER